MRGTFPRPPLCVAVPRSEGLTFTPAAHAKDEYEGDDEDEPKVPSCFWAAMQGGYSDHGKHGIHGIHGRSARTTRAFGFFLKFNQSKRVISQLEGLTVSVSFRVFRGHLILEKGHSLVLNPRRRTVEGAEPDEKFS